MAVSTRRGPWIAGVGALTFLGAFAPAAAADDPAPAPGTAAPAAAPAAAPERSPDFAQFSLGFNYSSGHYGDPRATEIVSVPFGAKYVSGPFTLRLTIPYVHLSGPGSLVDSVDTHNGGSGGTGSTPGGSGSGPGGAQVVPGGQDRKVGGISDIVTSATYSIDLIRNDLFLDLTGKVKLPTASVAKRLGTGKTDFTAAAGLTKMFGPFSLYAEGRRRFAGASLLFPVRDTWGATGGFGVRAARALSLGLYYDWQQSAFRGNAPSSELTGSATFRVSRALRVQAYATAGFSSNSVDRAAGLQLLWRLGR
jgi:hypothetical protein